MGNLHFNKMEYTVNAYQDVFIQIETICDFFVAKMISFIEIGHTFINDLIKKKKRFHIIFF
jgi:hypothetical protein